MQQLLAVVVSGTLAATALRRVPSVAVRWRHAAVAAARSLWASDVQSFKRFTAVYGTAHSTAGR